ncbi:Uncharacterized protein HZ326_13582 [Fusarium oxysporum f. sp. albedinis]|nr:Uncharacterized protein HZ326_13582 [Fusarium oxysporum f. sp. albedinis]
MYSVRYRYISTSSLLVCPSVSANPNSSCMQQFVETHNRWCMETETRSTDAIPPRDKGQAVKEGHIRILSVLNGTRPISIDYKPSYFTRKRLG